MKITRLNFNSRGNMSVTGTVFDKFIERIKADTASHDVGQFRMFNRNMVDRYGRGQRWSGIYERMSNMASYLPSVEIRYDKDGNEVMKNFNGLITLSVDNIDNTTDLETVKRMAAMLPTTVAAFVGSTGRSVKIIVCVEPKDGAMPTTIHEAEEFCHAAYNVVVRTYDGLINQTVQMAASAREGQMLYAGFRMPLDPKPYYNANAVPMRIEDIRQGEVQTRDIALTDWRFDGENGLDGDNDSDIAQMMKFLKSRYEFRYNKLERVSEFKILNKANYGWLTLDQQRFNSILLDIQGSGLNIWEKDFNRYLNSMKVHIYDPVWNYLYSLDHKWDGNDHIGRLADTVPTKCKQWKLWFRKWFIGMVAQWMGRDIRYGNSVAPLLISKQGYNKSTFCRRLLPREFRNTYIDNLALEEKKSVLIAMAQSLLINLDEFNSISPKIQQGFLKNIMQLPMVKVKMPYARNIETIPRRASFIATTNMTDILADPSGSRRFIGIELTAPIDVDSPINYEQLYAQAYDAIERRERYWFDSEETKELIEHNRQYQSLSPAEQYFAECFETTQDPKLGVYMSSAAIFERVRKKAGSSLAVGNLTKFGQFLSNIDGIVRRRVKTGTQYLVIPLEK